MVENYYNYIKEFLLFIKKLQKDVAFINKNLCKHCISDEIFKNSNKPNQN